MNSACLSQAARCTPNTPGEIRPLASGNQGRGAALLRYALQKQPPQDGFELHARGAWTDSRCLAHSQGCRPRCVDRAVSTLQPGIVMHLKSVPGHYHRSCDCLQPWVFTPRARAWPRRQADPDSTVGVNRVIVEQCVRPAGYERCGREIGRAHV